MRQKDDVQVRQDAAQFPQRSTMVPEETFPFIAKVIEVFSERMTCTLRTFDGQILHNIPVMTKAGLVNGDPYGEVCLPAINDYVIVIYASYGTRHKIILGTIIPYLSNEFSKAPVNSGSKAFLNTLLEPELPLEYRRIFKSGTSIYIKEDGTINVETPSGSYIEINESTGEIEIVDANGNTINMSTSSVTINNNFEVLQ